ncbi:Low-density lipoprotein receptor-related protein 1B [Amphibalanus amphitrite]|uniref:Low-density lipoprotein receptor-related protein 1B n=1 Tax=Amphibalanus amphitrite TaxID=1232801 RepID=A0A6A4X8V6_AMPAM|nr:Low-density lipoprotein receptor-related protein 1B [Amphibalanus amphitrite]KAF0312630.1 Low-density lipoprotein receptor-related protein 1B [Amphibalanus amphitrite]KAF0312632.1 Low-density lipoprotein receptor-related protein 1B [Amphibalanus amphitrite]
MARSPAASIAAAEEQPLSFQGSAAADVEQTSANDARSSASSSSSSSSSNEDVPEDLSHVNEPTEDIPLPSAGSNPGVGATQSREDSTGQLREQKSSFSSSLGDARTTSSTIHDTEEPVGATASEAAPDVVASTESSQTRTQTASSMLNQKHSVSKTDSNVSRRRSSLGQVSSATTRRRSSLGQTSSTVSQRRSSQSSSPASPPEAASPTKPMPKQANPSQQDISGTSQRRQSAQRGTPPSDASSPVRSRASLVRDGVSSVAKKSSVLVTQSSGIFRTGSAFRGARVSTDVVKLSPTPSDGIARRTSSNRGGGAPVRTAESRSGVKVTGSTTHPSSSGIVGPDRAGSGTAAPTPASPPAAATATSQATADSEGAQSPPMTLAGMLAGSTLASLARDGLSRLVHPAAAAPSTDSDSGPERAKTNLVDQCTVSRLRFCDGRLPYRTTSLPNFAGASSDQELVDNLVFFEAISESGCSPLAAEYVCAAMEPQCVSRPTPHVLPPCRHFCQDIVSSCGAAIPSSLSRNRAFNCSLMPDSTDPSVCYSSAADGCVLSEFACADQTSCLPAEWRCDGTPQCDDDSDELGCDGCSLLQYRCRPAGGCVDRTQLCDVSMVSVPQMSAGRCKLARSPDVGRPVAVWTGLSSVTDLPTAQEATTSETASKKVS